MALNILEDIDDPPGRRRATGATFGIERQLFDPAAVHGPAELPLQERLNEERKEVDAQERLDPPPGLQVHRGHLEVRLQLLEALLQKRLALVRPKELELWKVFVIGDQREDAVLKSVFGNLEGIDLVLDVEPRPHISAIPGALARPAPAILTEALVLVLLDLDRDPLRGTKGYKALFDSVADTSLLAVASPGGLEFLAQDGQRTESPLEAVVAGDHVKLYLPGAVEPDQPVALYRGCWMVGDRDDVCDVAVLVRLLPDLPPGDCLRCDEFPEVPALRSSLWQHGQEASTFAGDVAHVLLRGELRVGDIEKVRGTLQLPQQVPGLAMRLVVGEVSVPGEEVHGHGTVSGHGKVVEELLEIGTVILGVTPGDCVNDPTPLYTLFASALVAAAEADCCRVVVKLFEVHPELLDHMDNHGKNDGREVRFEEPIKTATDTVVVEVRDVTGGEREEVGGYTVRPFADAIDWLSRTDVVPDQEQDAVHGRDLVSEIARQIVFKEVRDLCTFNDSVEDWQGADSVGHEGLAGGQGTTSCARLEPARLLRFFSLHAAQSHTTATRCQRSENMLNHLCQHKSHNISGARLTSSAFL